MKPFLMHPLAQQALTRALATNPPSVSDEHLCPTRDHFRARADSLIIRLRHAGMATDQLAFADAVLSEFGNNAFDHNVGHWRDVPGVNFGADPDERPLMAIADWG